jgi:hypothetical protein
MGRHSSPEQSSFYRSLLGWFLPWVLVAAVAGVAVWIAVGALGQGPLDTPPPQSTSEENGPRPTNGTGNSPGDGVSPSPTPEKQQRKDRKPKSEARNRPKLITDGMTVQVLNATTSGGSGSAMANRLENLGFRIAAVGRAASVYDRTTVFWSFDASRRAGRLLARRFGWEVDPAPVNLSRSVALHVVVGQDEA